MLKQVLTFAGLALAAVIAAAPTHACVLDLLWDQMPKVARDYEAVILNGYCSAG